MSANLRRLSSLLENGSVWFLPWFKKKKKSEHNFVPLKYPLSKMYTEACT